MNRGYAYEAEVIAALQAAGIAGDITEGAGASAADADADMVINGQRYLVEVKADRHAQMGGTSVRYTADGFEAVKDLGEAEDAVLQALESRRAALAELAAALNVDGFPARVTKAAWTEARQQGLLKPVNAVVRQTAEFISHHYASKGVHYIQIGGLGLFYMGENPADLPVPPLEGLVHVEIRAARSGAKPNAQGVPVAAGSLRVQGRLQFDGLSPYTLDDPESIRAML